jgi:hypothetical protein
VNPCVIQSSPKAACTLWQGWAEYTAKYPDATPSRFFAGKKAGKIKL